MSGAVRSKGRTACRRTQRRGTGRVWSGRPARCPVELVDVLYCPDSCIAIDTRNVPTTAAGWLAPRETREREKRPTGPPDSTDHPTWLAPQGDPRTRKTPPAGRIHTSGPPPTATSAVYERVPPSPARVGSHMTPAPVRSVPHTDRWCLQLLTSMRRGCDTSPFSVVPVAVANGQRTTPSSRSACVKAVHLGHGERSAMSITGLPRCGSTANQDSGHQLDLRLSQRHTPTRTSDGAEGAGSEDALHQACIRFSVYGLAEVPILLTGNPATGRSSLGPPPTVPDPRTLDHPPRPSARTSTDPLRGYR